MLRTTLAAALALGATAAAACPNYGSSPSFGDISLVTGFLPDPYVRNITAGGRYDLAACAGFNGWGGTVASRPDFRLYWTGNGGPLTIAVEAGADTVLLVNDPNGHWFHDDDTYGLSPVISFSAAIPGQYDIWIGHYGGGAGVPGQLVITELPY